MAENIFDHVLENVDIYDVVKDFMDLEPKGDSYFGLCPFHNDVNKPSLSVKRSEQFFYCFTCKVGGSAIDFVSKRLNLTKIEATRYIANKYNIDVHEYDKRSSRDIKYEKYHEIMSVSQKFFEFLMANKDYSKEAREYLNSRGITDNIIKDFGIGLSSSDTSALTKQLQGKGYFTPDFEILSLSKGGRDSFIDRIIVPINDERGRVVAFGGRIYKSSSTESKYKNPTETPLFKKGNTVFNLDRASKCLLEYNHLIIVEGYMDVIQAISKGIPNMVALMGTAMTETQANLIKKYTNNVVLMLDGDKAGLNAMKSVIVRLEAVGINYKVVMLKDNLDPDEYLRKYGKDALLNEIKNNAFDRMGYLFELTKYNFGPITSFNLESFKREIFENLKTINQKSTLEIYLKKLSNELGVSFDSLKEDLDNYKGIARQVEPKVILNDYTITSAIEKCEKMLIDYSIYSKNYFLMIEEYFKSRMGFKIKKYRSLFVKIGDIYDNDKNISREKLLELLRIDGKLADYSYDDKISFSMNDLENNLFKTLKNEKLKIRREEIKKEINDLMNNKDLSDEDKKTKLKELSLEHMSITKSIKNIK